MSISKEVAIETWVWRALKDLAVQFVTLDDWHEYQPFFLHQGLEKLYKAYLIGRRSGEYETLDYEKARGAINQIATEYRHGLDELAKQVAKFIPEIGRLAGQRFDGYVGGQVLKILEAGYSESRYPVAQGVHRNFPIPNTDPQLYWEPLMSSSLEKFVFASGRVIIYAIEKETSVKIQRSNPYGGRIKDHDWERFCRLFLKEEVLCDKCKSVQGA